MGWWTEPVGSTPKKAPSLGSWLSGTVGGSKKKPPAPKRRSWLAQPVGGDKCPICNKRMGNCSHTRQQMQAQKVKVKKVVQVKQKDGTTKPQNRTVTRNSGVSQDDRGILWCDTCRARVIHRPISGGTICSNITCSTRR